MEIISIYENVATITNEMVAAAQSDNWMLLSKLEELCTAQVQILKDVDLSVDLAKEERERKVNVIKKILADDKKIRDITQPKMAQLSELMRKSSTQSKLTKAYHLDHRF